METFLLHPSLSPRACAPAPHKHSIPKQSNSHDNKRPLRDTARKIVPKLQMYKNNEYSSVAIKN